MTEIYLKVNQCLISIFEEKGPIYADWILKTDIFEWLRENCKEDWYLTWENSYTWDLYNIVMQEMIDKVLGRKVYSPPIKFEELELDHDPFKICKPFIKFSSKTDAILFKLRW